MKNKLMVLVALSSVAFAAPDGAEIFKKCGICHGEKAQKKSLGVSKIISGMKAEDIVKELKLYRAGKLNQYGFGNMMQGQATKLDDEQMQAVATYVSSLGEVKEEAKPKEEVKKISKDEVSYNTFMRYYFATTDNPNPTFEEAKAAYKQRQDDIKAGKPVPEITTKIIVEAEKIKDKKSHGLIKNKEEKTKSTEVKPKAVSEATTSEPPTADKPKQDEDNSSSMWPF